MSTEILLAISAGATLVLAIAAFLAIWQNRNLQRKERRQRLLNEIIEWAINMGKYMLSRNLPPFEKTLIKQCNRNPGKADEYFDEAVEDIVIAEYSRFRMQSVYILEISKGMPDTERLVNDTIEHLRKKLRLLNKYDEHDNDIYAKHGERKASFNIVRNEDRLYNSVVEIIKRLGGVSSLD
jgi:hypothetical protein